MSTSSFLIPEPLATYVSEHWVREPEVLARLRQETAEMSNGGMQISPDLGQFLRLLIPLIGAKKTLEVGVFTGYSSISTALALPDDGRIIACDVSEEFTSVARRYWKEAGVDGKIELRIAPAVETLDALMADGQKGTFDFAFIDADKGNYANYYERALHLLRSNGVILIDNVLWSGKVADDDVTDEDTRAIRGLNDLIARDDRVDMTLLPIGDGVTMIRKR